MINNKKKVIWFTGFPGSGKTTLAIALRNYLVKRKCTCVFLDGDDLYIDTKLEKQLDFYETRDDVDFLGTQSWNIWNDNESVISESCLKLNTYETHEELSNALLSSNVLTHGSMMIRKKCLDILGGYELELGKEDWNLWYRALNKGFKFYQIQERLYILRLGTSQPR